jgi:hypothetical protein
MTSFEEIMSMKKTLEDYITKQEMCAEQLRVIYNGVDFSNLSDEEETILRRIIYQIEQGEIKCVVE